VPERRALHTVRLVLRQWRDSDLAPFAAMNADPEVMEHFPAPLTRAESDALAQRASAALGAHGFGLWAVETVGAGDFIGFTGLAVPRFEAHFTTASNPATEIGWRLARPAWGHGYASEAARAVLAFGFRDAGFKEIVSFTSTENVRSQAVMRRIGMTHDRADDFDHSELPPGHRLRRHVLCRITAAAWAEVAGGRAGTKPG
jgi:ribosomal-protein-alanine N-acetyltransferase